MGCWARTVGAVRRFYGREPPADVRLWHKWYCFWPVHLVDGSLAYPGQGQLWRRRRNERWEYCQSPEDDADWEIRQHW